MATTHTKTLIDNFEAIVELHDDGGLDAYYLDSRRMEDVITVVLNEAEIVDGIFIPKQTTADDVSYHKYFEALCQFAAEVSHLPIADLREAFHPDVYEPHIRYRL